MISGTSGNDTIDNSGQNVTIEALGGDDVIIDVQGSNYVNDVINAGAGNDSVVANAMNITVNGGAGNDTINGVKYGHVTIDAGDNDDYIYLDDAFIDGSVEQENSSISGGAGDDTITGSGNYITVNGGAGDDTIEINGSNNVYIYNNGDGNDIINMSTYDTLIIGDGTGTYSTTTSASGYDVIVEVGDGQITLGDAVSFETLNIVGEYEETAVNWATVMTAGNSTLISADETVASGTDNADTITTAALDNDTISRAVYGNAGNDVIQNAANNVTIDAGSGNDTITNTGSNVVYDYTKGNGNDVINGFTANDTLYIEEAAHPVSVSGNDLIVTVGNGKITLSGAATLDSLNITGSYDESARAFVTNLQQKTALGYPVVAQLLFHPNEYHGFETLPSDYYASSETLTIDSSDGLELMGYHYTPENSNDKWALIVHGYGHNHNHMNGFAEMYLANGYNVLMIDQRAAGESEGEWLTMGSAESEDVALWTQKIAELNPNAKIVLHGVSMGAATAMLAAANSNVTNVTSLVEDCGYTTVMNLIDLAKGMATQLADSEFVSVVDDAAESLTGHRLTSAAPIDSIGNVTIPSIFITGNSDTVVSMSNLEELYEASGAEVKEIFTVEGATHGLSALTDSIGYANTVFRFNAEAAGEGWVTSNTADEISLRGTSYDDTISNSGSGVTINAMGGNDTINNNSTIGGNVYLYNSGDGEDVITGFAENDTIIIDSGTGEYNTIASNDDVIINTSSGSITLKDAGEISSVNIEGEQVISTFNNTANGATIVGTALADTINNSGSMSRFKHSAEMMKLPTPIIIKLTLTRAQVTITFITV